MKATFNMYRPECVCYSDLFTYNTKYFQTLSGEKWRPFANSLRRLPKLRSTSAWSCLAV